MSDDIVNIEVDGEPVEANPFEAELQRDDRRAARNLRAIFATTC